MTFRTVYIKRNFPFFADKGLKPENLLFKLKGKFLENWQAQTVSEESKMLANEALAEFIQGAGVPAVLNRHELR